MVISSPDTNSAFDSNVELNFDKRVLIEQVRYIEAEQTRLSGSNNIQEPISSDFAPNQHFEGRLWQRAYNLVERNDSAEQLVEQTGQAAKRFRLANLVVIIIAILLGAFGISYAINEVSGSSHTINIYWLLLILLGFNFISMLLWFVGITLNAQGLTSGVLARLAGWLPSHFRGKENASDRAWFNCHFSGRVGKWHFSKITHRLWLVYLFTGLIFLFILLMVRQYDFVWGTTLLSDHVFVTLTEVLSMPLQVLGFSTPTIEQIQQTRIGAEQILTVEHRSHWAQFLLGALLCFGILPRLLLLVWSILMHRNAQRRFKLDHYLPYYIHLRQQLMPLATHGQIIDADQSPPVAAKKTVNKVGQHTLPEGAKWVAVETDQNIKWPPASVIVENDFGQIVDRDSLAQVLQRLQQCRRPVIAIAVSSIRPPDRGIQRLVSTLKSNSEQGWLVLLQSKDDDNISESRLADWYRLAETVGISADHVISMRAS